MELATPTVDERMAKGITIIVASILWKREGLREPHDLMALSHPYTKRDPENKWCRHCPFTPIFHRQDVHLRSLWFSATAMHCQQSTIFLFLTTDLLHSGMTCAPCPTIASTGPGLRGFQAAKHCHLVVDKTSATLSIILWFYQLIYPWGWYGIRHITLSRWVSGYICICTRWLPVLH